ncbi:MAG: type II secretion system protein [Bacilli bacterium]|nr:type II secretion system protein [Bacilli bacterium]
MKKIRRRNGFTMVELLAVILILGIVTALSVVSIQEVLRRARSRYYTSQEENLTAAGRNYMEKNQQYLPKVTGQKTSISADELIKNKYISSLVDYSKQNCHASNSYVQVIKNDNGYYYDSYLECDTYRTNLKQLEGNFKNFNVIYSGGVNDAKAKITLQEDKYGIGSYQYTIFNSDLNQVVFTSENYEMKGSTSLIERTISLKNHTPGTLEITLRATNIGGAEYTFSKSSDSRYKDDGSKLECGSNSGVKTWTSSDRTITVQCKDDSAKVGCAKSVFTKKFTTSMKNSVISIMDKNGVRRDCPVPVYIDKDKPEVTTSTKISSKDNLSFTLTDNFSLAGYAITTTESTPSNWTAISGDEVKKFTKTVSKSDGTYYVYVKDSAGNVQHQKQVVLTIGTPTVSLKAGKSNLSTAVGSWTNQDVTMTLKVKTDDGVKKWQYSHDGTNWSDDFSANPTGWQAKLSDNNRTASYTINWDGSWNFYVRAISNNGAVSPASSAFWIGRDTVVPSCGVSIISGHLSTTKWSFVYDTDIVGRVDYGDDRSGVKYYDIQIDYTSYVLWPYSEWKNRPEYTIEKTTNRNSTAKFTHDESGMFYGYVKDYAGNGKKCWAHVQKDTKAPYAPQWFDLESKKNATILSSSCSGDCGQPAYKRGDYSMYYKVKCPCGVYCELEYTVPYAQDREDNFLAPSMIEDYAPQNVYGVCGSGSKYSYGKWHSVDDSGHVGNTLNLTVEWVN